MTQSELHNELAPVILRSIIEPVLATGGSPQDVLALLESVAVGVVLYLAESTTGGQTPEQIIDLLAGGLKSRAFELHDIEPPETTN